MITRVLVGALLVAAAAAAVVAVQSLPELQRYRQMREM